MRNDNESGRGTAPGTSEISDGSRASTLVRAGSEAGITAMRRSDPYMERARELCLAAGIDPDSRVGEGRGQPAWCSYRDAARKEHLAREANTAASEIANRSIEELIHTTPARGPTRQRGRVGL